MRVSEVKRELDALGQQMREQFAEVDQRFEQVDRRFEQMDRRFEQMDQRFAQMDQRFEQVDQRFEQVDQRLGAIDRRFDEMTQLIVEEGRTTRRHFDIVAEQLRGEVRLALEHSSAISQRVDRMETSNDSAHAEYERMLVAHGIRLSRLERADENT